MFWRPRRVQCRLVVHLPRYCDIPLKSRCVRDEAKVPTLVGRTAREVKVRCG
jgi:hypothetical protein